MSERGHVDAAGERQFAEAGEPRRFERQPAVIFGDQGLPTLGELLPDNRFCSSRAPPATLDTTYPVNHGSRISQVARDAVDEAVNGIRYRREFGLFWARLAMSCRAGAGRRPPGSGSTRHPSDARRGRQGRPAERVRSDHRRPRPQVTVTIPPKVLRARSCGSRARSETVRAGEVLVQFDADAPRRGRRGGTAGRLGA